MPDLIKLIAGQYVVGACLVTAFAVFLILTDAWGLGTLIWADQTPILTAGIFIVVGIVLLAPLVVGTAIFLAGSSAEPRD